MSPSSRMEILLWALRRLKNSFFWFAVVPIFTSDHERMMYSWIAAVWWIKAAIQEYILRSWSLVKMGTTANQKKLFFNLRKAKSKISAQIGRASCREREQTLVV